MFRGYWIAGIALGLTLLVSVGHAQDNDESSSQPANHTEPAQGIPQPLAVVVSQEEAERQASHDIQEEANRWNEQNVLAQRGIERSTHVLKWAAIWQTVLLFFGTLALIATLVLMQQANSAANKAANAAEKAVPVKRAWAAIHKIHLKSVGNGEFKSLIINWRIHGDAPAVAVKIETNVLIGKGVNKKTFQSTPAFYHLSPVGSNRYSLPVHIPEKDYTALFSFESAIEFEAICTYKSASLGDVQHETIEVYNFQASVAGVSKSIGFVPAPYRCKAS